MNWISVKDGLPCKGQYVLAIHRGGVQNVMLFEDRFKNRISLVDCFILHGGCGQYQEFYDVDDNLEITHWMPLPAPPEI